MDAGFLNEHLQLVFQTLSSVLAILASFSAVSYVSKLHQRQNDAIFTFLAQMHVRLQYIKLTLDKIDDISFFSCLTRGAFNDESTELSYQMLQNLEQWSKETLSFLSTAENQYPPNNGWLENLNDFVDLLTVCENLTKDGYYYWTENDLSEVKQEKLNVWKHNIDDMLEMIHIRQQYDEIRIMPFFRRVAFLARREWYNSRMYHFFSKLFRNLG